MTLRDIAKAIRMTGVRTEGQELRRTRRRSSAAPRVASGLGADLLVLEPRILFDGAGVAVATQVVDHAEAQAVPDTTAVIPEANQTVHSWDVEASAAEEQSPDVVTTEPLVSEPAAAGREIVFIDPRIADYHTLLAGIEPKAEVVLLNADQNGMEQIAEVLAGRKDLDAIHIISHGTQAELTLGTAHLTLESMNGAYADELAVIGQSLSEKADLLIYGCNFGQGEQGAEAATMLGQLTGADVAVSTDDTGHASLGGDWDLEFATGLIETHTVVCQPVLEKWFGLLDLTSLQATQDTYIKLQSPDTTNNFGASTSMVVDRESTDLQRALLQFDLSSIPAGSTINSATLKLQSTQIGGTLNIAVYEVTQAWSEGTGNGTAGAANWNERQTGTNWTTAGGTFNSTAVATLNTDATGQHTWTVTSLVQAWFNGTNVNNGLMVASPDGGGNRTVTYDSSEGTTVPVLEINYTPPSNTAPTITNLSGDSLAYSEDAGAVVIEQGGNATVSDADSANFDTGTLTVSFTAGSDSAEDVLGIRNQGTGAGQIGVSGSNVTYQGVTIGTFTGGSSGSNLVITMNSSATPTVVTALVKNITFMDTDTNAPTTGARTVRFVLTDGDGGTSANSDTTVTVSGVNDAPTITNLSGDSLSYAEGDGAVVIEQGGNATVTDVDSANFDTGTLTVSFTAGSDSAEDVLAIRNQGTGAGQIGVSGANVTYQGVTIGTFAGGSGGSNLVMTMNSSATPTAVTALVQNITYENTDTAAPTTGARTVRYVLTDGDGGTSANYDTTVTASGVNDAPNIVDATVALDENSANATAVTNVSDSFTGTDLDRDGQAITYSLTAGNTGGAFAIDAATGALTVANSAALDFETTPSFTLTVTASDGTLADTAAITVNLNNLNDAPTITSNGGGVTASVGIQENTTAVTTVTSTDVDGGVPVYSIVGGVDAARFTINGGSGILMFTVAPDFEAPTDVGANNLYDVTIQVDDSAGGTDTQTITITIADVAEGVPPTTPLPPVPPSLIPQPTAPPSGGLPGTGSPVPPPVIVIGPTRNPLPTPWLPGAAVWLGNGPSGTAPAPEGDATAGPSLPLVRELREYFQEKFAPLVQRAGKEVQKAFDGQALAEAPARVSAAFLNTLSALEGDLQRATETSEGRHRLIVLVTTTGGITLTAGLVAWLLRSGTLLASLLSALPAWRHFDPLPVTLVGDRERREREQNAAVSAKDESKQFHRLGDLLDDEDNRPGPGGMGT